MVEELDKILKNIKKGTPEERINALASIIEDMMQLVLTLPGIFDQLLMEVNEKIVDLETQIRQITSAQIITKKEILKDLEISPASHLPPPPPSPKPMEVAKEKTYKPVSTRKLLMDELRELIKKREMVGKTKKNDKIRKLRCSECGLEQEIPMHCGKEMHKEGTQFVCWKGGSCATQPIPSHHGKIMEFSD